MLRTVLTVILTGVCALAMAAPLNTTGWQLVAEKLREKELPARSKEAIKIKAHLFGLTRKYQRHKATKQPNGSADLSLS